MSALLTGLFLCSAVRLDPLLGEKHEPTNATLEIAVDGSVRLNGFENIRSFGPVVAALNGSKTNIAGAGTDMGFVVWGEMLEVGGGFQLNWFGPGEFAKDGRFTTAKYGEASCQRSKTESVQ
jgi:hypothetical protein